MSKKIKVAFITNIIAPYRITLFNRLKESNEVEFKVFFEKETSEYRHWSVDKNTIKFNYEILKTRIFNKQINGKQKRLWVSFNILSKLIKFKPNVVVCGGYGVTYAQAFLYCFIFRKKLVLWGELTTQSELKRSRIQKLIRKIAAKIATAAWAPSTETKKYYESLGMHNNIYVNLLTIDSLGVNSVSEIKYLNNNHINFLYVGSISHRKGVDNLIQIYLSIRKKTKNVSLTLVGEKSDELKFVKDVMAYDKKNGISFVSFTNDVGKFYNKAHIFILPCREDTFGLVVPEAMSYGLPIVCSKYAGCANDLIKGNGVIIDPENIEESARKISELISDRLQLVLSGKKSINIIKKELNDTSAKKLNKMFKEIMG